MSRFSCLLALAAAAACAATPPASAPAPSASTAPSASSPGPAAAPTAHAAITAPFLWTVEKDGKRSHLFGTLHVGIDAEKELPAWFWERLDASRVFATEVDAAELAGMSGPQRPAGTTLQADLGPAYWAKLEAAVGAQTAARFQSMPAGMVALILTITALPPTPPMDIVLRKRIAASGKRTVYLESIKLQVEILARIVGAMSLVKVLDDLERVRERVAAMAADYRIGDEALMAIYNDDPALMNLSGGEADKVALLEDVLYARNRAWIPAIEPLLAEGDAFIAGGVGHFVGEGGVIELLRKKGYKVVRVKEPEGPRPVRVRTPSARAAAAARGSRA